MVLVIAMLLFRYNSGLYLKRSIRLCPEHANNSQQFRFVSFCGPRLNIPFSCYWIFRYCEINVTDRPLVVDGGTSLIKHNFVVIWILKSCLDNFAWCSQCIRLALIKSTFFSLLSFKFDGDRNYPQRPYVYYIHT